MLVIIACWEGGRGVGGRGVEGYVIAATLAVQPIPLLWPLHFCFQFWVRGTLLLSGRTEATLTRRGEAGHTCLSLGNALVLKKAPLQLQLQECLLRKKGRKAEVKCYRREGHGKDVGPVAQDRNVNDVRMTSRFYCEIIELMWRWKITDCIGHAHLVPLG